MLRLHPPHILQVIHKKNENVIYTNSRLKSHDSQTSNQLFFFIIIKVFMLIFDSPVETTKINTNSSTTRMPRKSSIRKKIFKKKRKDKAKLLANCNDFITQATKVSYLLGESVENIKKNNPMKFMYVPECVKLQAVWFGRTD